MSALIPRPRFDSHQRGILLAASGVLVLSFDALLVRLAAVDPWTVALWRGLFMALALFSLLCLRQGRRWLAPLRQAPAATLMLAALYGVNGSLFVLSVSHTSAANTVVILASSAFFAALFSRWLLQEAVKARTWAAIAASISGVLIVFAGSLQLGNWLGDGLAVLLALSTGLLLSLLRRFPGLPRMPIVALSGLVMLVWALPWASFSLPAAPGFYWLALMGLVQIPLASILIMEATRHLSSPEVSLFLLIETILGPLWVWWVLREPVSPLTFAGGSLILAAISLHSWAALRESRRRSSGEYRHTRP